MNKLIKQKQLKKSRFLKYSLLASISVGVIIAMPFEGMASSEVSKEYDTIKRGEILQPVKRAQSMNSKKRKSEKARRKTVAGEKTDKLLNLEQNQNTYTFEPTEQTPQKPESIIIASSPTASSDSDSFVTAPTTSSNTPFSTPQGSPIYNMSSPAGTTYQPTPESKPNDDVGANTPSNTNSKAAPRLLFNSEPQQQTVRPSTQAKPKVLQEPITLESSTEVAKKMVGNISQVNETIGTKLAEVTQDIKETKGKKNKALLQKLHKQLISLQETTEALTLEAAAIGIKIKTLSDKNKKLEGFNKSGGGVKSLSESNADKQKIEKNIKEINKLEADLASKKNEADKLSQKIDTLEKKVVSTKPQKEAPAPTWFQLQQQKMNDAKQGVVTQSKEENYQIEKKAKEIVETRKDIATKNQQILSTSKTSNNLQELESRVKAITDEEKKQKAEKLLSEIQKQEKASKDAANKAKKVADSAEEEISRTEIKKLQTEMEGYLATVTNGKIAVNIQNLEVLVSTPPASPSTNTIPKQTSKMEPKMPLTPRVQEIIDKQENDIYDEEHYLKPAQPQTIVSSKQVQKHSNQDSGFGSLGSGISSSSGDSGQNVNATTLPQENFAKKNGFSGSDKKKTGMTKRNGSIFKKNNTHKQKKKVEEAAKKIKADKDAGFYQDWENVSHTKAANVNRAPENLVITSFMNVESPYNSPQAQQFQIESILADIDKKSSKEQPILLYSIRKDTENRLNKVANVLAQFVEYRKLTPDVVQASEQEEEAASLFQKYNDDLKLIDTYLGNHNNTQKQSSQLSTSPELDKRLAYLDLGGSRVDLSKLNNEDQLQKVKNARTFAQEQAIATLNQDQNPENLESAERLAMEALNLSATQLQLEQARDAVKTTIPQPEIVQPTRSYLVNSLNSDDDLSWDNVGDTEVDYYEDRCPTPDPLSSKIANIIDKNSSETKLALLQIYQMALMYKRQQLEQLPSTSSGADQIAQQIKELKKEEASFHDAIKVFSEDLSQLDNVSFSFEDIEEINENLKKLVAGITESVINSLESKAQKDPEDLASNGKSESTLPAGDEESENDEVTESGKQLSSLPALASSNEYALALSDGREEEDDNDSGIEEDLEEEAVEHLSDSSEDNLKATEIDTAILLKQEAMEEVKKSIETTAPTLHQVSKIGKTVSNLISTRFDTTTATIAAGDEEETRIKRGLWVRGMYGINNHGRVENINGYRGTNKGATIGFDVEIDNNIVGIAYSNVHSVFKFKNSKNNDKEIIDSHVVSVYGQKELPKDFALQALISASKNFIKDKTTYSYGDTKIRSNVKHRNHSYNAEALLNYNYLVKNNLVITPNIGLRYGKSRDGVYNETGINVQEIALTMKENNILSGIVGTKVKVPLKDALKFNNLGLTFQGAVEHNFKEKTQRINRVVKIFDTEFKQNYAIPKQPKTSYNLGTGIIGSIKNTTISLDYNYYLNKHYRSHQGSVKLKVNL